jgi:hemolysin activation/secretion protein
MAIPRCPREKGFYLRNDLEIPVARSGQSFYFGLDAGEVFGPNTANLQGTRIAGAVMGFRGVPFSDAYYDVFLGGPLYQPQYFPNRWPVMGFTLNIQV